MTTNIPHYDWFPVVSTLAGVIVAGFISFFLNKWNFARDRDEKRRAAAMQIGAQLRSWLIDTIRVFRDHHVFYQPDPNEEPGDPYNYYFPTPSDIPPFPFADNLDQISRLKSGFAETVFLLVEKKSRAEHEARVTAETNDYERAAEEFEPLIAAVWFDCLKIYKSMAKELSWSQEVITSAELAEMTERATPKPREENADFLQATE